MLNIASLLCLQMELSRYLRQHARTIAGKSQLFINSYAKALEVDHRRSIYVPFLEMATLFLVHGWESKPIVLQDIKNELNHAAVSEQANCNLGNIL